MRIIVKTEILIQEELTTLLANTLYEALGPTCECQSRNGQTSASFDCLNYEQKQAAIEYLGRLGITAKEKK
jgi:hypothetical protein